MKSKVVLSYLVLLFVVVSCGPRMARPTSQQGKREASVPAQRKVAVGMTHLEVSRILGVPSFSSKDAHGRDAWVYEKAAKEVSSSPEQKGVWFVVGTDASSQPITLVIKFDSGVVSDVTYHSNQIHAP